MLVRGQRDRVVAESGNNFVKLSCGMWVSRNAVSISNASSHTENVLQNGVYRARTNFDILAWQSDEFPAIYAQYDGNTLTVNFGMQTEVPPLTLSADLSQTIFSSYSSGIEDNVPYYKFDIRDDANLEGFYALHEDGEFRLYLKKRKALARGERPLSGFTIVVDPGHGGEHSGAIGPMGYDMAEKDINLINSLKLTEHLQALGATVHMTRDTDVDISLQERVNFSWQHKPDLFISLHINSVAETTDATNIRGFTVHYRNPNSISFSQTVLDVMHDMIPGSNRHRSIKHDNFFVCRPVWAPSVLFEAGFIVNINDFVWLLDPENQEIMAEKTVDAILEYFG